jgi:hypothetical protein
MVTGVSKNNLGNVNAANRSVLNFIEGSGDGIVLTITDDPAGDEVDIEIGSGDVTTTTRGTIRAATQTEINAGTVVAAAVTPFYLENSKYVKYDETATLTNKTFDANGTGNSISNIDLEDLSATGTPSPTTYLRGDNTWATVAAGDTSYLPRILSLTAKTATFTAAIGETHVVDTSGGTFTANLPAVAGGQGRIGFYFVGTGSRLTLDPSGAETIAGKTTLKIDQGHNTIENDGTEWKVVQSSGISPLRLDPAQITATQDGYNPADWGHGTTHLYIDSDASREIQGFEEGGFNDMEQIVVTNDGAFDIVIKHDTSTTVANRVLVDGGADFTLGANQTGILMRDGTANKWRFYGISSGAGGGGNVATDAIFDAAGDLVVGTGADASARLPIGANTHVLTSNGTTATWAAQAGGGDLLAVNNLSDVASASTSLANLGGAALAHTHVISDITDNVAASTGVLTGGLLSVGTPTTTFSISNGTGTIVDTTGAITNVSWTGLTNLAVTDIASQLLTWVSINSSGTVVQRGDPFTADVRRSEICLGVLVHVDKTIVDNINTEATVAFNPHATAHDLASALGFINVSGNVFSANGANLNLNKTAGEIFYTGANYDTSSTNPHVKTLPVLSALTFQYRYSDGSNGVTGIVIDPDNLDNGIGGLTAVSVNRYSIQRIYSFLSNNVKIQRGVADYTSMENAIAGISSEAFVTEPSLKNGLLRGWLIVKEGTTSLADPADARFIEAGKLGEVGSAVGGGAGNVVAEIGIAVSDETTALTTGVAKAIFRMPYAMTVTDVRATVTTAPTGSNIIVDINDGVTSIMTTDLLSIDATEKTSTTAVTAPNITDTALADDAEITIDIDQIGSTLAGAGLKIWIIGTRA